MKPNQTTTISVPSLLMPVLLLLLMPASLFAAIPDGYYSRLTGKSTADLKTELSKIINPHVEISSYSALPSYFEQTDVYPGTKRWWDMYSDIPFYAPSFKGLNREHSFPKSWWGGATNIPAYVDLFHLYPAEADANMAKSNYPLGVVTGTPTFDNGISRVGRGVNSGGAAYVYEPDDDYKGDFARTYFYIVTCYQDLTWKYQYMARNGAYPTLQTWAIDLLLDWHRKDPVSQKEIDRNETVYRIQNNRNPFIDYPDLAEYIWGNKMGQSFVATSGTTPSGDATLTAPVQDMTLDFNDVAVNHATTSRLYFKGENLTGSLELSLSGTDAKYFRLESNLISASAVNSESGFWLPVTYTPTATGEHSARLRVQDGGLAGSIGIALRGNALPVPDLGAPTALPPTDITSDSYIANWTPREGDVVDYYLVTRTIFRNGAASVEELLAEENSLEIDGFNESDSETYAVRSVRLGIESPESNTVAVTHASLSAVDGDTTPLVAECYEGGLVRFVCGGTFRDCAVYDAGGRLAMMLPAIDNGTEITLEPGVYLLKVTGRRLPLKIIVR
ncbi:MAG: endonuclease [Clostridium sp.]|nr:endonuclease [Clostridium sp.]